ncbi:MAG: glutamate--tRNA ligase [Nitrospinae bacterium]|nr:glutamate--tRNA ligase [Nitrospinota bacterium]
MNKIITRFAPSPTGALHIGGVRTALFSWLYAQHCGGKFLLRIEDTDKERSTKESEEEIMKSMQWLGMVSDEPMVYQSQREEIYKKYIQKLLEEGKAYRCVCTQERLQALREECMANKTKPKYDGKCRQLNIDEKSSEPFVIRIKCPLVESITFEDTLRGAVSTKTSELDDFIIARSDGAPTYNFVVAIDDHEMGLTHIIRGNDHIANTPKQIMVYQGLGFEVPKFTHLSMILNKKKQKLSKRDNVSSVLDYKKQGYLPSAIINYLVRLGWSHGDQEIFTTQELIDLFDISGVNKSNAVYDEEKLLWVNAQHLRKENPESLYAFLVEWLKCNEKDTTSFEEKKEEIVATVSLFTEKAKTLEELFNAMSFFLNNSVEYDPIALEKFVNEENIENVKKISERFTSLETFSKEEIEKTIHTFVEENGLKFKTVGPPLRIALTGSTSGIGLNETIATLGKEKSLERINTFLAQTSKY